MNRDNIMPQEESGFNHPPGEVGNPPKCASPLPKEIYWHILPCFGQKLTWEMSDAYIRPHGPCGISRREGFIESQRHGSWVTH
jgi:hypothetical protein